mmetsp:Transcript_97866/g.259978  ORF Transcript_97866/g.259978 Transcript_97866/m.259978 type:complete len:228 (-) Transcript_97866:106-789(-)
MPFEDALARHNELRAQHGAPPLQWCEECAASARRQADACKAASDLHHGHMEGPAGAHGQNAFQGGGDDASGVDAVDAWYREVDLWNGKNDFDPSTGHFTQVVWVDTEYVGMAQNGPYIVANYWPPGNFVGAFAENVAPKGSAMVERRPRGAGDCLADGGGGVGDASVTSKVMSEIESLFKGCPFPEFKEDAEECISNGGTVTVKRAGNSLEVSCKVGGCTSSQSGSW